MQTSPLERNCCPKFSDEPRDGLLRTTQMIFSGERTPHLPNALPGNPCLMDRDGTGGRRVSPRATTTTKVAATTTDSTPRLEQTSRIVRPKHDAAVTTNLFCTAFDQAFLRIINAEDHNFFNSLLLNSKLGQDNDHDALNDDDDDDDAHTTDSLIYYKKLQERKASRIESPTTTRSWNVPKEITIALNE